MHIWVFFSSELQMWADSTSCHSVLFPLLFLSSYSQFPFSLEMVFLWTSPLICAPLIWQRLLVFTLVHENCLHFPASLAVGQGSVISCHQWAVTERCPCGLRQ